MTNKGFTLIELMIVVAIIGVLALIAIPNFVQLRAKAYDSSALSAGYNARIAEALYYHSSGGEAGGKYASDLADLLRWDKNLTDDPSVTFTFGLCTGSGYTFTAAHAKGDTQYVLTD